MRRVAAVLVLVILQVGCQFSERADFEGAEVVGDGEPDDSTEEPAETPESAETPVPPECGALLAAQKTYLPNSEWIDGTSTYEDRRRFAIPERLVVTEGNGGNHCAILELSGYWTLSCHYLGGSDQSAPQPADDTQWNAGLAYNLVGCTWGEPSASCTPGHTVDLEAGESVRADRLKLHVASGAFRSDDPEVYNPTLVYATLKGACDGDGDHYGEGEED